MFFISGLTEAKIMSERMAVREKQANFRDIN